MAKDYFSHDYNARNDKKLTRLFMKHSLAGIGAYWCIIEMLYEEGGYLLIDEYERISFELRVDFEFIKSVIEDFDLFENDDVKIWSETALDRLKLRAEKSQKARESIEKRWNKHKIDTNVLQPNNDSNTSKGKERKVKEIKEEDKYSNEIKNFTESIIQYFPIPPKKIESWFEVTDKLVRIDNYKLIDIEIIIKHFRADSFWIDNFQSYTKLRKKKDEGLYIDFFKNILISKHNGANQKNSAGRNTTAEGLNAIINQFPDSQSR